VAFKVTTVFDQEELLARERDQPMFTPAVRRDIYRVLRNPRNPAEGARTNDGPAMFESVLLAKSSERSAAWDSFAFARRGGNPSGYTVLDDEQMLEAISCIGKITPVALAVTQAFETYLSQMAESYWGEREAALLSVDFLVAFGNEMTQRLDVNNRIRSTRLTPQEIQVLSEQPFANFVDRESFEAFQGPGDDWRGEEPIPLAGNYGNSDLGMDSRNTYGSANQPSQQRQPPLPPQQQPAPGYNDWGRSNSFNNNNYNINSQPGGGVGVGVGGYENGNSYAGRPDPQRGMGGPLPPGGSNNNNNNNNNYNTNSQPVGGGGGVYGNSYAGGPDPQRGMGAPTTGGANDGLRSNSRMRSYDNNQGGNNVNSNNNNNSNGYERSTYGGARPNDGRPNDGRSYDGRPNDGRSNDGRPNDGRPNDGRPNDGRPNDNGQPPRRGGSRKDNAQWDSRDDSSKGWYDNF
jgi:hypothetical protein